MSDSDEIRCGSDRKRPDLQVGLTLLGNGNQLNLAIMKINLESTVPNIYHWKKQTQAIQKFSSSANSIEKKNFFKLYHWYQLMHCLASKLFISALH